MPDMPKFIRAVPVVILAGCVSTAPRAPIPITYYFDCDVPPGKFSEWTRTVDGSQVRATGTLQLIEPRHDPAWRPVASVFITGNDDSLSVGLRAMIDWHFPEVVHLLPIGPDGLVMGKSLISMPWRGELIPFAISFNNSGELKVSAAGQSRELKFHSFNIHKVELICSTSQFKFTNVVVEDK